MGHTWNHKVLLKHVGIKKKKKKLLPVTCIYLKKRFGYKMEQTQNSRDLYMKCIFHVDIIEAFPGGLLV